MSAVDDIVGVVLGSLRPGEISIGFPHFRGASGELQVRVELVEEAARLPNRRVKVIYRAGTQEVARVVRLSPEENAEFARIERERFGKEIWR